VSPEGGLTWFSIAVWKTAVHRIRAWDGGRKGEAANFHINFTRLGSAPAVRRG